MSVDRGIGRELVHTNVVAIGTREHATEFVSRCNVCGQTVYVGVEAAQSARLFREHAAEHGISVVSRKRRPNAWTSSTDVVANQRRARLAGSPYRFDGDQFGDAA